MNVMIVVVDIKIHMHHLDTSPPLLAGAGGGTLAASGGSSLKGGGGGPVGSELRS